MLFLCKHVLPVAKIWPGGQVKATLDPKVVSILLAIAPVPAESSGQSAEYTAEKPIELLEESVINLKLIYIEINFFYFPT